MNKRKKKKKDPISTHYEVLEVRILTFECRSSERHSPAHNTQENSWKFASDIQRIQP
jgi:hypothetical protein